MLNTTADGALYFAIAADDRIAGFGLSQRVER